MDRWPLRAHKINMDYNLLVLYINFEEARLALPPGLPDFDVQTLMSMKAEGKNVQDYFKQNDPDIQPALDHLYSLFTDYATAYTEAWEKMLDS